MDIYPSLVEFCGLNQSPNVQTHGHPLDGFSLAPLLDDPQGSWDGPPVALSSVRGQSGVHHAVRSERYRYILCQNGEEELYDHQSDPHEWENFSQHPEYQQIKSELRQELLKLRWQ
ncbi:MAG: DUF4976 domain-containing protein [Phycisphaeraceae bacterium]|nr:DUF4976 domain-containing protein [Phycisphaeraceae bacterium]